MDGHHEMAPAPLLTGDISDTLYHVLTLHGPPRSDMLPGASQSPTGPGLTRFPRQTLKPGGSRCTQARLLPRTLLSPGKWPLPSGQHLRDKSWWCDGLKAQGRACARFLPPCNIQVPSAEIPVTVRSMGNLTAPLLWFLKKPALPAQPPQSGDLPVNALVIVVSIEELYLLEGF